MHFSFTLTSLYIEQTSVKLFFFFSHPSSAFPKMHSLITAKWTRFDKALFQTSFYYDWPWVRLSFSYVFLILTSKVILPDILNICILIACDNFDVYNIKESGKTKNCNIFHKQIYLHGAIKTFVHWITKKAVVTYILCVIPERAFTFGINLVYKQNFPKNRHLLPSDTQTSVCYQGVRNIIFSDNFAFMLNESSLFQHQPHWLPEGVTNRIARKNEFLQNMKA